MQYCARQNILDHRENYNPYWCVMRRFSSCMDRRGVRCKHRDILRSSGAKSARLGERSRARMPIILGSSGFERAVKCGSLHVGSAEKSESDFVLPRQKIAHGGQARQTAIPPKSWRSRKIGGQEGSAQR